MSTTLLAESVAVRFGDASVLSAGRLAAPAGTLTCVVGRNGAGKSTLLRVAVGAMQSDSATVRFRGELVEPARLHVLARRGLFYLPDRNLLSPTRTLAWHFAALRSRFGATSDAHAASALRVAGLMASVAGDMSTGERRRAEVALALARDPACLVADEPLRGIDPIDRELITGALRSAAARGCAVVMSGHEVQDAIQASDRVVWVTAGTTYELGGPAEALQNERFRREYLAGVW